jgi:signal transduction histidine kinase
MTGTRWWDVFFGAAIVLLGGVTAVSWAPSETQRILAWVTLTLLAVAYLAIGREALRTQRLAHSFAAVIVISSGVLVACLPSLATVQAIAFPLIWSLLRTTSSAIVANTLLALSVAAGFLVALGTGPENLAQTAVIQGISLVGSLALGLWISRIAQLSEERRALLDELTAAQGKLSALSRDSGVTSERERLAREIHDTIAQSLTGLVMLSQQAQRELAANDVSSLAERLTVMEQSAREALVETRSLVAASAPVELGGGITAALVRLAARFERETGITVTVDADASTEPDRDTEVVLLRCAQEALANVRKHSRADAATLSLTTTPPNAVLTVHDDGTGFDPSSLSHGFGLPGMRDRLALVRGSLEVGSSPGAGTTLTISLPLGVTA